MKLTQTRTTPARPRLRAWHLAFGIWHLTFGISLAFDTAWHYHATERATLAANFTPYATDVAQMGTWGPDFFFILYQELLRRQSEQISNNPRLALVPGLRYFAERSLRDDAEHAALRRSCAFLHFDNLHGALDTNPKFHHLLAQLLLNTRRLILQTQRDPSLDPDTRHILILLALGTSLHALQDFYSHTNWTHLPFRAARILASEPSRAPTYFEAARQRGWDPARPLAPPDLPFPISSGLYPVPPCAPLNSEGVPMDHGHMSHDNTQMRSSAACLCTYHLPPAAPAVTDPSAPLDPATLQALRLRHQTLLDRASGQTPALRLLLPPSAGPLDPNNPVTLAALRQHSLLDPSDMAPYHRLGDGPSALDSPADHQQYAFRTAAAASAEWLRLLGQGDDNLEIRLALDTAAHADPPSALLASKTREAAQAIIRVSLLVGKWDGDHPAPSEKNIVAEQSLSATRVIRTLLHGTREILPNPFNRVWSLYVQHEIPARLTENLADPQAETYAFPQK